MNIKNLTVFLFAIAAFASVHAQTLDKAKLDQYFDQLSRKNKAMGTMVISHNGKVVYSRSLGFGEINGTVNKPLTDASRYRIASITKMYTAVMILQLIEEGKLELTDTLSSFFPQIPNAGKITIAHILAHRSGVHDALIDPRIRTKPKTSAITKEEIVALIAQGKPDFEPGTKHLYSNSGYALLGLIIEKIGGKPYAETLSERISSKLGLKNTYVATGNIDPGKNESLTYRYSGGWKQEAETHPSNLFGAGSIISTPVDMALFIQALFDLRLISQQSLAIMQTIKDGEGSGMEPFTFAGKTFYGHTGGGDNYGAWLAYSPEDKIAIAYTTNAKVHPVADIMMNTLDIFYNKPFEIPTFESIAVSTEIMDKYAGVYATADAPVKFTITRNGATLYIQPPGQGPVALEALSHEKFKIEGTNGVTFEFDSVKNQMAMKRPGLERVFTKEK